MLDEWSMGSFNQQSKRAARPGSGREADRFGLRYLCSADADDIRPAADDRRLDKTKATERAIADSRHQIPCRSRPTAPLTLGPGLALRHRPGSCHSVTVTANPANSVLQHYVDNFRRLPWRSGPGEAPPDPYVVWLSEIMLQQTTATAVMPRFERFLDRWPTVEALADAEEADILAEWAGLGYYARARNLAACARVVAGRGSFPEERKALRALPGVGDYTSAAIAAIAFGRDEAPVDTNVTRVLSRLDGIERPQHKMIERRFLELSPAGRAGDFAQALMDLGATICRPRAPCCALCPLQPGCAAFASGKPESFPQRKPRRARPKRYGIAYWIERDGSVWLVRRPPQGLLGGMAALPGTDWTSDPCMWKEPIGTLRHVFTHFALELAVELRTDPIGEGWWQPIRSLDEAGLPSLYAKAARLAA